MTQPNLHDMIFLVNQHQLSVRNLFQTEKGWRANIGNGMEAAEFGEGACIEAALDEAIDKAVAKGFMKRETPFYIRDQEPEYKPDMVRAMNHALATIGQPAPAADPFADD